MVDPDFEAVVEQSHGALLEITNGDSGAFAGLYSTADDVTLANPFGGIASGPDEVRVALDRAASNFQDGEIVSFDHVTAHVGTDVAYLVEVERYKARVAGGENPTTIALRVTSVFRREDTEWKLVHRHADPRVDRLAPELVFDS